MPWPSAIESSGQVAVTKTTTNGDVVVITGKGRFNGFIVQVAQAETITFFDNATTHAGTWLGYIAASPLVGTSQFYDVPFANGIVMTGTAGGSILTVIYALD